jgi:hypothetical protein
MLTEIEKAIVAAVDSLTADGYGETDGAAITAELENAGKSPPPGLWFGRTIMKLRGEGLFGSATTVTAGGPIHVELTGYGREVAKAEADPVERVVSAARMALSSRGFAATYPAAFEPWADAEKLLWADDVESQLTTIGHKTREATQAFASALVEAHKPTAVDPNPINVEKRLGAVIAMHRPTLPESHRKTLEALGDLWEATNALIQRQEHGAQKEGEPITWDDARRVVYLTMFLMIEFVSIFEALPGPQAAVLEPAGRNPIRT